MYEITFYDTDDGKCPVQDFLDSLEAKLLAKTLRTIDLLETNGPLLREPYSKYLEDGIFELRTKKGFSQDELAERICVTRQAVSRWENGETVPNTETLKLLSKLFDVSINTLLGSPRKLICQCCGMPLEDSVMSKEPDGDFNEDYCKWCYAEGQFAYKSKEALIDYLVANMPNPDNLQEEDRRVQFDSYLSRLKRWK